MGIGEIPTDYTRKLPKIGLYFVLSISLNFANQTGVGGLPLESEIANSPCFANRLHKFIFERIDSKIGKINFPNLVQFEKLTLANSDKHLQLSELLKKTQNGILKSNNGLFDAPSLPTKIIRFKIDADEHNGQIKINSAGTFKLVLSAGKNSQQAPIIVDSDATDGTAQIDLPSGATQLGIHLQQNSHQDGSLDVVDNLYYLSDTIKQNDEKGVYQDNWYMVGTRPIPVPKEWHSSDEESFVLKIETTNVMEFQLSFSSNDGRISLPPGTQEIGPDGGHVELPGLAKLEIPPGALDSVKTIRMLQETSIDWFQEVRYSYAPVAPPIRIEPQGHKLLKSGYLQVFIDESQFEGGVSTGEMQYVIKTKENPYGWQTVARIIDPDPKGYFSFTFQDRFDVPNFSTFLAVANPAILKTCEE